MIGNVKRKLRTRYLRIGRLSAAIDVSPDDESQL
jgi:hypothetical protein